MQGQSEPQNKNVLAKGSIKREGSDDNPRIDRIELQTEQLVKDVQRLVEGESKRQAQVDQIMISQPKHDNQQHQQQQRRQ
jgi:hypothetical protein